MRRRNGLPPRRIRRRYGVLVVLFLVAAMVGTGLTVMTVRDVRDAARQARQHALVLAGRELAGNDCAAAEGHLRFAASGATDPGVVTKARMLQAACPKVAVLRARTAAAERAGNRAGVVTANLDFLKDRLPGGFGEKARTDIRDALLDGSDVRAFTPAVCGRSDEIIRDKILTTDAGEQLAPRFYAACASTWVKRKDSARAEKMRVKLRAAVRAAIGVTLAQPVKLVQARRPVKGTVLVVSSTSQDAAELVIVAERGPAFGYVTMPPCNNGTCQTGEGADCDTDSFLTIVLPAGRYHVLHRFPGNVVTTSAATWNLANGTVYTSCIGG